MRQHHQDNQHRDESSSRCHDVTVALEECLSRNGSMNGEACIQEKLLRKECFAKLLCPNESRRFYVDKIARSHSDSAGGRYGGNGLNGGIVSCATIVQKFAFPENELLISHETSQDPTIRQTCRHIVHELSRCLSKHNNLWSK